MQDSEDTEIVKSVDNPEEENIKAKLKKKDANDPTENNNVENDVTPAVNGHAINDDAVNGEAVNGEATNGYAAPEAKDEDSAETPIAAVSMENTMDEEAAETEKSEGAEINQVVEASSSKDDEITNGTNKVEVTPDEKEDTQELRETTEEVKEATVETMVEKDVGSGKESTTMVQIPGSASVVVTSEKSASAVHTPDSHEERSVDPHPPDPDQVLPADKISTHLRHEPVKLRLKTDGPESEKPISIPTLLITTVKRHANGTALVATRGNQTMRWTYAQYFDDIKRAARAFIKLGLEVHHAVCILGFNSPEWFIADLAAIVAGGFATGIYTTNSPEACHYVAHDSEANICVVENDAQLQKILQVRDRLPHLRAIIQYTGELTAKYSNVYTWSEFMNIGKDVPEDDLIERIRGQAPNKCCTLIYTSGTTGPPKGVMLSHDNLTWTAQTTGRHASLKYGQEVMVSYLPLSHIAAQLADILIPLSFGATVHFAKPDALKGTLKDTLKEARPTFFFGVPRVWEKMASAIKEKGAQNSGLKRTIGNWAKGLGLKYYKNAQIGQGKPTGYGIANALMLSKVQKELGLDRCQQWTGAAPISTDTLEYLASVGIIIMELYGLSESTGPHTVSLFPHGYKTGSTGIPMAGCHTQIDKPNEDGNGEIMMNGRHIFMGYLNKADKTAETIDEKTGWMRTGDIGKLDEQGHLYITGRIKEILITAGGENVAPTLIEDAIKKELPVVSNAMVIGDRKKFLSCLLTLKTKMDLDTGAPLDDLTPEAIAWCRGIGCQANKLSEILDTNDTTVMKAIQDGIDRANNHAISRAQKIQKWTVLPRDFSIHGGELGPTTKTMRHAVNRLYEKTINTFYGE